MAATDRNCHSADSRYRVFSLRYKAVIYIANVVSWGFPGKFIIFSDGVAPPLIRPTSKCRLVKPKAPPNRLSNSLFIRKWDIAGIATNILHIVDIETKKKHNPLILLVAPARIELATAP